MLMSKFFHVRSVLAVAESAKMMVLVAVSAMCRNAASRGGVILR